MGLWFLLQDLPNEVVEGLLVLRCLDQSFRPCLDHLLDHDRDRAFVGDSRESLSLDYLARRVSGSKRLPERVFGLGPGDCIGFDHLHQADEFIC